MILPIEILGAIGAPQTDGDSAPDAQTLQPHQQRVVDEKRDLDERRAKLSAFMATPIYGALEASERMRLARQFNHMTDYSLVLGERIAAFQSGTSESQSA